MLIEVCVSVTWVDWSIGGPYPAIYAADNITEGFLQSIRKNETDCVYNEEPTSFLLGSWLLL
ncbi:unnamed protein product [Brassica rapa subsp. trilocularis]